MWIAGCAKLAAIAACALLAAACAENRVEPPAIQVPPVSSVPPGSTQDFFLNVGDRIFFNENSAELSPTALTTLDKQGEWLVRYPNYRITIEGHSDEKASAQKNMALSKQRAEAAARLSVITLLVLLLNPKFATTLAARCERTLESGH